MGTHSDGTQASKPALSAETPARTLSPTFHRWGYTKRRKWHYSSVLGAGVYWLFWVVEALCMGFLILFVIGIISHPIIAAVVFLFALYGHAKFRRRFGIWQGGCPHCGEPIAISAAQPAINCPICTKRVLVKDAQFRAV
jgi:hypothetical protein